MRKNIGMIVMMATAVTSSALGMPDFAGKWTREGSGAAGGFVAGGFNCGGGCDITVSGNMMTITRPPNAQRASGNADRVATLNTTGDATYKANTAGGQAELTTTGKRDGDKLLFSTKTRDAEGKPFTLAQTVSLNGAKLIVASNSGPDVTYTRATP